MTLISMIGILPIEAKIIGKSKYPHWYMQMFVIIQMQQDLDHFT